MRMRWILLAAAAAGCGDPLADGDYRGEPIVRLEGRIVGDAGTSAIRHPYIGILWSDPLTSAAQGVSAVATIDSMSLPNDFSVSIWDPPPPQYFADFFGSRFALGLIVALDDVDGNGKFAMDAEGRIAPPDVVFGASFTQAMMFLDESGGGDCGFFLFGTNQSLARGVYRAGLETCDAIGVFPIIPEETPLTITLFPPSSVLPVPETCEEPIDVDCEANPDDPACAATAFITECLETRCAPMEDQIKQCMDENCATGEVGCDAPCAELQNEMMECFMITCSPMVLCAE